MTQRWRFINLDKRIALPARKYDYDMTLSLHDYLAPDLVHRFVPLTELQLDTYGVPLPPRHPQTQSELLTTLPPELLIHVFVMIDTDIDLAYMSLACQMLYNAGLSALNARQARSDLWAGDRLCYVGESIEADDLPKDPEPVLTDKEVKQLQLGDKHPPTAWDDEYTITLFNAADEFRRAQQLFADIVATHLQHVAPSPSAIYMLKLWSRFVRPQLSRSFKDAVLLNHTRREYVRRQTLVERQTRDGGVDTVREFKHVRLGDVAAFWMRWASHWQLRPSDALFSHELNRGRWAGSRVSIIEAAEFRAEDWKDVGAELIEDVARVYKLVYTAVRR